MRVRRHSSRRLRPQQQEDVLGVCGGDCVEDADADGIVTMWMIVLASSTHAVYATAMTARALVVLTAMRAIRSHHRRWFMLCPR